MEHSVTLTSRMRVMIPIIKVVGNFCNLRCRYCFYHTQDQTTPNAMDLPLLEKFIRQYLELFSGRVTFIWHGGEPLLAGIDFFVKAIELERRYRHDHLIENHIQTNGTLIDGDWASFFKEHNFRVGISLDGTRESHDAFRVNASGRGSFDSVIRGIDILRKSGIQPGFIQTLTRQTTNHVEEEIHFFSRILRADRGWGMNVFANVETMNGEMTDQAMTNAELTRVLMQVIDQWLAQDEAGLRIREVDNFLAGVIGKKATNCTFNGTCTAFFCLEHDGRIFPCDRLSHRNDLRFGSLKDEDLLTILNGPIRMHYASEVNHPHPGCDSCAWQRACHNGCTADRVGGVGGKYYFCETRKEVFAYLNEKVEALRSDVVVTP